MTVEEVKAIEKRNVLVGIRFDAYTKELLNWALVKVADQGDQVVAVHVCANSDSTEKAKLVLDGYLGDYEDLCNKKQVELNGLVLKGSSIQKVLVREAKNFAAVAVIVGINKLNAIGCWASIAKYCARKLPPTTEVLAIHSGKVEFRRWSNSQLPGFNGDSKPSLYFIQNPTFIDNKSEFGISKASDLGSNNHEVIHNFEDKSRDEFGDSKNDEFAHVERLEKSSLNSVSLYMGDLGEQKPGWPLLQRASSLTPPSTKARKLSIVQWLMTLPSRSSVEIPQAIAGFSLKVTENNLEVESRDLVDYSKQNSLLKCNELPENLELSKRNSSGCKWFSHSCLINWTSQFSSENLIGKGGCNSVYKGLLPDGTPVAVKILTLSEEARKDFTREINIMTTLKHKNITPLLGICIKDEDLISVYDFLPKGNLEENIHGHNKENYVLSWEVRFNIAVGIAEALHYLHNECYPPIIHRDVKSSNILLSNEYEPQLSDFGLAIWGPTTSCSLIHSDVVGTFGYLAPEYFMYGKVSDKIDVYSFGVILLELLSGRKPIDSESPKGQGSLVMWAKPKLEFGDVTSILDPNLYKNVDEAEMHRMAVVANLCLTRAARLRPKMSQILKILRGDDKDVDNGMMNHHFGDQNGSEYPDNNNDDEVYPDSSADSHLGLALQDVDDPSTSFSSVEQQSRRLSLEDYFKGRWSRSSSFD